MCISVLGTPRGHSPRPVAWPRGLWGCTGKAKHAGMWWFNAPRGPEEPGKFLSGNPPNPRWLQERKGVCRRQRDLPQGERSIETRPRPPKKHPSQSLGSSLAPRLLFPVWGAACRQPHKLSSGQRERMQIAGPMFLCPGAQDASINRKIRSIKAARSGAVWIRQDGDWNRWMRRYPHNLGR